MSIIKTLNYSCKISLKEQDWKCNKEDSINFLDVFFIHLIKSLKLFTLTYSENPAILNMIFSLFLCFLLC